MSKIPIDLIVLKYRTVILECHLKAAGKKPEASASIRLYVVATITELVSARILVDALRNGLVQIVARLCARRNVSIMEIVPLQIFAHVRLGGVDLIVQHHSVHRSAIMAGFVLHQIPASANSGKIVSVTGKVQEVNRSFRTKTETL